MTDDKPRREILINETLRTEGPLELELADGRKLTVHASGSLSVRHPVNRLAAYELDLPTVEHVARQCQELGNDQGGMGSGEVPITVYHKH